MRESLVLHMARRAKALADALEPSKSNETRANRGGGALADVRAVVASLAERLKAEHERHASLPRAHDACHHELAASPARVRAPARHRRHAAQHGALHEQRELGRGGIVRHGGAARVYGRASRQPLGPKKAEAAGAHHLGLELSQHGPRPQLRQLRDAHVCEFACAGAHPAQDTTSRRST